ncbi:MAG: SseB family protein [Solirubrobacterales bacterium]
MLEHALLDLPPGAPVDASLADMLVRAELLLPHTPGEDDRRKSFTTVPVADGRDAIPLFTSVPAYEAYFGVGGPKRARLALSAFAGLDDIPVVIDPGTDLELVIDPAEVVELGGSHGI